MNGSSIWDTHTICSKYHGSLGDSEFCIWDTMRFHYIFERIAVFLIILSLILNLIHI
jgi:hypothetical protein